MVLYNLTNITAANSTVGIIQSINIDLTGGSFSFMLIITLFAILFVYNSKERGAEGAFLAASFLTSIMTGLLFLAGVVGFSILITVIIVTVIATILAIFMDG